MSDTNPDGEGVRVSDRRRFDPDGNPRDDADPSSRQEGAGSAGPSVDTAEAAAMRQELETARKRVDELARAYQGLQNDREEYKQRLARERERLLDVERGKVALVLLEAIDQLDLCLQASAQ